MPPPTWPLLVPFHSFSTRGEKRRFLRNPDIFFIPELAPPKPTVDSNPTIATLDRRTMLRLGAAAGASALCTAPGCAPVPPPAAAFLWGVAANAASNPTVHKAFAKATIWLLEELYKIDLGGITVEDMVNKLVREAVKRTLDTAYHWAHSDQGQSWFDFDGEPSITILKDYRIGRLTRFSGSPDPISDVYLLRRQQEEEGAPAFPMGCRTYISDTNRDLDILKQLNTMYTEKGDKQIAPTEVTWMQPLRGSRGADEWAVGVLRDGEGEVFLTKRQK